MRIAGGVPRLACLVLDWLVAHIEIFTSVRTLASRRLTPFKPGVGASATKLRSTQGSSPWMLRISKMSPKLQSQCHKHPRVETFVTLTPQAI